MSIEFTYKVEKVDQQFRVMEVLYSAAGRDDILVSCRLPFEGESIEDVVRQAAPIGIWLERETSVQEVIVGTSGSISPTAPQPESSITPTPTLIEVEKVASYAV